MQRERKEGEGEIETAIASLLRRVLFIVLIPAGPLMYFIAYGLSGGGVTRLQLNFLGLCI